MNDSKVRRTAPGGPGIEPRWTLGVKIAVGTAYSTSSRLWYTLDHGCVTEVYYPTIGVHQKIRVGVDWFLDLFFPKNLLRYRLSRVLQLYQAHGTRRTQVMEGSTVSSASSNQ